jgi:putative FmdB family regulatory protein
MGRIRSSVRGKAFNETPREPDRIPFRSVSISVSNGKSLTWNDLERAILRNFQHPVRFNPTMPTYEYRCPKGHEFEHFFRTISAGEGGMKCPECGETAERKVSGGSGLLFKGSGFYITDYGKDGKKDQRKASESSKSDSGSTTDSSAKSSTDKPSKGSGSSDA